MFQPIISIIIPCYNSERFIAETLECLQKQTINNWEAIIVNDGSTDSSATIAKEYASRDSRYIVIDQPNAGPAVARNNAIMASSGKYILPLDADDLIDPTYAEKGVSYLEEHFETKLIYCKCNYFGVRNEPFVLPDYSYKALLWCNPIFCSCIYRKCDVVERGGYDPKMQGVLEDWEFLINFLSEDDKVYCIPETLFFYRQHDVSRNTAVDKYRQAFRYIVRKHFALYEPYCLDIIYYRREAEDYRKWFYDISNSKSFRFGQWIFAPLKWIKRVFAQRVNES